MADEFKVKNGLKFPDNTVQTTAAVSGGATVSTTPPGSPGISSQWFDSDNAMTSIYYDNGANASTFVALSPGPKGFDDISIIGGGAASTQVWGPLSINCGGAA